MKAVHFAIFLHSHQPVGNFDKVFHKACEECYDPLLAMLFEYPEIRLTMHFSGSLLEWVEEHRPDLSERLASMVRRGQVELMGGGYYEPILTMLTEEDRQGQLRSFSEHLRERYGTRVRGAWLTERVWEQCLVSSLAAAGIEYTALDDSHFHSAGLADGALRGSFVTEDEGRTLRVFPGSERLRYVIPFHDPEKTLEYLASYATDAGGNLVTYADDGEKFGIWPKTHEHVYKNGWLRRWLDMLRANRHWVRFLTGSEAIDRLPPCGKVYLPDASYREMMEWALPAEALMELEDLAAELKTAGLEARAVRFLRGGSWRSFRTKYTELAAMYAKMMRTSAKVNAMKGAGKPEALRNLYRGQCNCAWWHGVFGGLYLPHLRRGVKRPLILAEAAADSAARRGAKAGTGAEVGDFDYDGHDEVSIANRLARATFHPAVGGHLMEFSSTELGLDFEDTLTRRKEAYHRKVLKASQAPNTGVLSIHDISVVKERGLEKLLQYDWYPRRALVDHVFGSEATVEAFARCEYAECGDFAIEPFTMRVERAEGTARVVLSRAGGIHRDGGRTPLTVTKTASLGRDARELRVEYELLSAGPVRGVRFGVEVNVSLVAGGEPGCYYRCEGVDGGDPLEAAARPRVEWAELVDEPGGYGIHFGVTEASEFWVFPVQTVSQSESGFERVFQSAAVVFSWPLDLEPGQPRWVVLTYGFRAL